MHDVTEVVERWTGGGRRVVVARPVAVSGFGARVPGAALVVSDDDHVGTLLGGAVDTAVLEASKTVTEPRLIDVPVDADAAAACGLACSGVATILLTTADDVPAAVWADLRARRPVTLVTGPSNQEVTAATAALEALGRSDAAVVGETVVERFVPTGRLLVVGAAELGAAVVGQATLLGWDVELVTVEAASAAILGPADAVCVLSHEPAVDEPVLLHALRSDAGFVGAIGSRGSQVRRRERLLEHGLTAEQVDRLHGPLGLDLGPTTPAESALSICAEVLAVRSGRTGAPLRDTTGRITG